MTNYQRPTTSDQQPIMTEIYAVLTIGYRDLAKLLRDPLRLVSTFILPLLFILILGGSMQLNLGSKLGYNFLPFTFTGVFAQTLFQSAAMGIISLIEDRESDFSQEIFVSPISRYTIILGKMMGETLVALTQGFGIVLFGMVAGISFSGFQLVSLLLVGIVVCLFGASFGVIVLSNLNSQRAANQIFPFIMLPQFFLAGVFNPVKVLPWYLDLLSRLSPMRYAVDFVRGVFYTGQAEYSEVILQGPVFNFALMAVLFWVFLVVGTFLFVRGERNR
jgi:ABC-2 type transport system permease protein